MGLDMYLYAKQHISGFTNEDLPERYQQQAKQYAEIVNLVGAQEYGRLVELPSVSLTFKVGQWRKANAIHAWFVDNVQGGEDECKLHYVSREQLQELAELVEQVLADLTKADELLPCREGFFFGTYEYNEWYYDYLRDTRDILNQALTNVSEDCDFYYQSSW